MIPPTLKIGASTWMILMNHEVADDGERGHCKADKQQIAIDPLLPEALQEETLIHELLHACAGSVGIRNEKMSEEEYVTRLSGILHTVLKENNFWPTT